MKDSTAPLAVLTPHTITKPPGQGRGKATRNATPASGQFSETRDASQGQGTTSFHLPSFFIPAVPVRQADGSVIVRAGKPIAMSDDIGTMEAARILGLSQRCVEQQMHGRNVPHGAQAQRQGPGKLAHRPRGGVGAETAPSGLTEAGQASRRPCSAPARRTYRDAPAKPSPARRRVRQSAGRVNFTPSERHPKSPRFILLR